MKHHPDAQPECDMCVGNRQLLQQLATDIAEIKAAQAHPAAALEALRIGIVNLQPGDVLTLTTDRHLSYDEIDEIRHHLGSQFPGVKAAILDTGMEVGVIRRETADHDGD